MLASCLEVSRAIGKLMPVKKIIEKLRGTQLNSKAAAQAITGSQSAMQIEHVMGLPLNGVCVFDQSTKRYHQLGAALLTGSVNT